MLCTFQIQAGTLIVQSEDIKAIVDEPGGTSIALLVGDTITRFDILGTALENMARIQQEELDLVARVEMHRQALAMRYQAGLPNPPVKRGKA